MIDRAIGAKVPFTWLAADEVYGDNGPLRASLEGRRISYVLAVSCDHRVPAGAGHAIRADKLAARLPGRAWQRPPPGKAPKATATTTGPGSPSAIPVPDAAGC
jgi:SRSO17 transposase